jgi:hypothetical protein
MNASPIFKLALGTARIFSGPWRRTMQTIVQNRRSEHSARRAHARILLSYEDQLYHQAE